MVSIHEEVTIDINSFDSLPVFDAGFSDDLKEIDDPELGAKEDSKGNIYSIRSTKYDMGWDKAKDELHFENSSCA